MVNPVSGSQLRPTGLMPNNDSKPFQPQLGQDQTYQPAPGDKGKPVNMVNPVGGSTGAPDLFNSNLTGKIKFPLVGGNGGSITFNGKDTQKVTSPDGKTYGYNVRAGWYEANKP